ncbi:MAG: hypothetical protein JXA66_04810 [Oligoflexia bacterium]|nr:hypothetical protein [Oligoflexia bacterium]
MVKFIFFTFFAFLFCDLAGSAELTIIYTNNIEGGVLPCNCAVDPGGGVVRRLNWLKQSKITTDAAIYVDAGDTFFQSSNFDKFEKDAIIQGSGIIAESLAKMNIDAFTPGELDLVMGIKHFNKITEKLPVLITNSGSDKYQKAIKLERAGYKITILGVLAPSLVKVNTKNFELKDMVKELKPIVKQNRSDSDIIVLLAHTTKDELHNILKNVKGIDIVISAHSDEELRVPLLTDNTVVVRLLEGGDSVGVLKYNQVSKTAPKVDTVRNNNLLADIEQLEILLESAGTNRQRINILKSKKEKAEKAAIKNTKNCNVFTNSIIFMGSLLDKENELSKSVTEFEKLWNKSMPSVSDDF